MSSGFVILCAFTARSMAYLQALHRYELNPELVIFFGSATKQEINSERNFVSGDIDGLFYPDFSEPHMETVSKAGWKYKHIDHDDIGSAEMMALLSSLSPELTIYSGYGGQIVPDSILANAGAMLHVHTGWLPQYRGSTTLYYSILNEGQCAASALLLDTTIDTGPVVARKKYPQPKPGLDIDYLYDTALRADLLCEVISRYSETGDIPEEIEQQGDDLPYYVIHPVLKHIAMLSVDNADGE